MEFQDVTVNPNGPESAADVFARLAESARSRGAAIASVYAFGPGSAKPEAMAALGEAGGMADVPLTWVTGSPCAQTGGTAAQAMLVVGATPRTLYAGGRALGRVFENETSRVCHLGGIGPDDPAASPETQTSQTFARAQSALAQAGMTFRNVVRTWLYNRAITTWYGPFNAVRTACYRDWGVLDGPIPASTGIGADNPDGAALTMGLLAVQPKAPSVSVRQVPSPLQGAATSYGSTFSRAVEIALPGARRLMVSGTASIAPDGRTVHLGDVAGQVACTMGVLEALLRSRGMGWADVTRAIAYFRDARDAGALADYARQAALPALPVIVTQCDICRDDLLFEMELDAAISARD